MTDLKLVLNVQVMMDAGTYESVWHRFENHSNAREWVVLSGPTTPVGVFIAEYSKLDFALVSMPYNGGTKSCDALWMGVPVVNLAGGHFYGRLGSSILTAVGRSEWIATYEKSYIAIATDLAGDVIRLKNIRTRLRRQIHQSRLCDAPAFTRDLEQVFRGMQA